VDEQVARQRLGQHWFITVYKAAYIQGLYTVYNGAGVQNTVAVLGLATNQGQPPHHTHLRGFVISEICD
jgi:hypothetical protein